MGVPAWAPGYSAGSLGLQSALLESPVSDGRSGSRPRAGQGGEGEGAADLHRGDADAGGQRAVHDALAEAARDPGERRCRPRRRRSCRRRPRRRRWREGGWRRCAAAARSRRSRHGRRRPRRCGGSSAGSESAVRTSARASGIRRWRRRRCGWRPRSRGGPAASSGANRVRSVRATMASVSSTASRCSVRLLDAPAHLRPGGVKALEPAGEVEGGPVRRRRQRRGGVAVEGVDAGEAAEGPGLAHDLHEDQGAPAARSGRGRRCRDRFGRGAGEIVLGRDRDDEGDEAAERRPDQRDHGPGGGRRGGPSAPSPRRSGPRRAAGGRRRGRRVGGGQVARRGSGTVLRAGGHPQAVSDQELRGAVEADVRQASRRRRARRGGAKRVTR